MPHAPVVSAGKRGATRLCAVCLWLLAALTSATALSAEAQAASRDNLMEGTVDGEEVRWRVPSDESIRAATYTNIVPGVHRITVNAYRDERNAREGSLALELVTRPEEGIRVSEILYFPFAETHPRFSYTPQFGEIDFETTGLDFGVDTGRLTGQLEAELFYHQSASTQPIPHRTSRIELDFDLELTRD